MRRPPKLRGTEHRVSHPACGPNGPVQLHESWTGVNRGLHVCFHLEKCDVCCGTTAELQVHGKKQYQERQRLRWEWRCNRNGLLSTPRSLHPRVLPSFLPVCLSSFFLSISLLPFFLKVPSISPSFLLSLPYLPFTNRMCTPTLISLLP